MSARNRFCVVALLMVVVVGGASSAFAYCSSCNSGAAPAYSVGYAAPVSYSAAYAPATYTAAYAPTYTTAYAPAYTTYYSGGWYPGRWLGRANRSIWGVPQTTYYAPAVAAPVYTAAYAPTTAYYAPAMSYAAPACSTCTANYAPACSTCSACGDAGVITSAGVVAASSSCPTCTAGTVTQSTYVESVPSSSSAVPSAPLEPTPALPTDANVAPERSIQADKPVAPAPGEDTGSSSSVTSPNGSSSSTTPSGSETGSGAVTPEDTSTQFQAPKLLNPNGDPTVQRHQAPVWTAVYHKVDGATNAVRPISHAQPLSGAEQEKLDAAGWSSAAK
jgi:hypothetical protein